MFRARALAAASLCALSAVALGGCFIDTDDDDFFPVSRTGSVTVRWSINGTFDPNLCFQASASTLRVDVYFLSGALQGEYIAPCEDFQTRIDLPEGDYFAGANLEGGVGTRTTTVDIDPFTIVRGSTIVVDVDFPASSFF